MLMANIHVLIHSLHYQESILTPMILIIVGVHFFTLIRKYGTTDPYSVFYHSSIRIIWFIKVD